MNYKNLRGKWHDKDELKTLLQKDISTLNHFYARTYEKGIIKLVSPLSNICLSDETFYIDSYSYDKFTNSLFQQDTELKFYFILNMNKII